MRFNRHVNDRIQGTSDLNVAMQTTHMTFERRKWEAAVAFGRWDGGTFL